MTKEELEHNHIKEIADKYVHESWGTYLDLDEVDLVLAGIGVAKIISKEKDERIKELEVQIEKMKKYGKLLQDICTAMGNDPYMVSVGLENRVKVLWDSSEEKEGLKMVEDIENRLLKIKPQDWAEIEKWEIRK